MSGKDEEIGLRFLWRIIAQVGQVSGGRVYLSVRVREGSEFKRPGAQHSIGTGYLSEKFPYLIWSSSFLVHEWNIWMKTRA